LLVIIFKLYDAHNGNNYIELKKDDVCNQIINKIVEFINNAQKVKQSKTINALSQLERIYDNLEEENIKTDVSDDESNSEDEDTYEWNVSTLNKMKKYKNNKVKLYELMTNNNIPKELFNKKMCEL